MRISYSCPAHLKFSLTVERMSGMVRMSRETIEWLAMEENEKVFDCCYMIGYAATAAALIEVSLFVLAALKDDKLTCVGSIMRGLGGKTARQ